MAGFPTHARYNPVEGAGWPHDRAAAADRLLVPGRVYPLRAVHVGHSRTGLFLDGEDNPAAGFNAELFDPEGDVPAEPGWTGAAVAGHIRELRARRRWSARRLAEACALAGAPSLNRVIISKIECGARPNVTAGELAALARVFDVSPDALLTPGDPP